VRARNSNGLAPLRFRHKDTKGQGTLRNLWVNTVVVVCVRELNESFAQGWGKFNALDFSGLLMFRRESIVSESNSESMLMCLNPVKSWD
jgi:hypothetical protein